MSQINQVIRARKSVYPRQFIDKPIAREIIEELLENANHAPTHKLTEPWRFKVFTGEARISLGEFLAEKYKETVTDFSETKFEKVKSNPPKAGAVLAIVLHRDPEERVPEWEEIAAVACAVQNIWIACKQYGLGGYWSTPTLMNYLGDHVALADNERCIGFFYLGHCDAGDRIVKKRPIQDKVEWVGN